MKQIAEPAPPSLAISVPAASTPEADHVSDALQTVQSQGPTQGDRGGPSRLQKFFSAHLIGTVSTSFATSLVLFGVSTWNVVSIYQSFKTTVIEQFQLQSLSGEIVHLDEVLTMSARMAATTGDLKWEKRYRSFEPELIQAIEQVGKLLPEAFKSQPKQVDEANTKLIEMENRAFDLVRKGQSKAAFDVLMSQQYETQKQIYAEGNQKTISLIERTIDTQLKSYNQRLWWAMVLAGVSLPVLLLSAVVVIHLLRNYIRQNRQSYEQLARSQESLLQLNSALESKSDQLSVQEQATIREKELLQLDVTRLLEVITELEAGDLTARAEIGQGETGLVADTLNRLVEELTKVLIVVQSTAQQVTVGAEQLETLATTTAQQAQQQSLAVVEVEDLMATVSTLSQDAARQAVKADEVVFQARSAVDQGQQEMLTMSVGIDDLQQGAEQIVRRVQTLKDFVDLAVQFTQSQKRIAALTRVLALNASMIAGRASAQQDPEQFAGVAREFETIATQVNDLAVQTNQSLLLLQQRTDQIQTAVSGIGQDVRDINGLVNQFTTSVDQSRQVFDDIQNATQQVAEVGQQVTLSSQSIAQAAQTTLTSIQQIAGLAIGTEQQSRLTQEQVERMEELSRTLQQQVQFFRLGTAASPIALDSPLELNGNPTSDPPNAKQNGHSPSLQILSV